MKRQGPDGGDPLPEFIITSAGDSKRNAITSPVLNDIFLCPVYLRNWAGVADEFLFHANTIYQAYVEGKLVHGTNHGDFEAGDELYWTDSREKDRVLNLAQDIGGLALSAVLQVAATLLHEIIHCFYFLGDH